MLLRSICVLLASVLLATPAGAAPDRPLLRVCTGATGGAYHQVGERLAEALAATVEVEVIQTHGSWENLEAIDQEPRRCDAVIAQEDAYALYQFEKPESRLTMDRMTTLYGEAVHLICNRDVQADDVAGLHPQRHRILVNQYGSGTYITWRLFGRLDPAFARFKAREVPLEEGLLKIVDGVEAQCMVIVGKPGQGTAALADRGFGDRLKVLQMESDKLHQTVGRDRRPVYRTASLTAKHYPRLLKASRKTQWVDAVFFASPQWKARYPEAANALARALLRLVADLSTGG